MQQRREWSKREEERGKTAADCEGREYGKQRSSLIEISFAAVVATASLMDEQWEQNANREQCTDGEGERKKKERFFASWKRDTGIDT